MPAKMVFVRTENADSVATALETHAAATGAAWGEILAPFLAEGEELPDMTLVQRLMARLLVARGEALQQADQARLKDRDRITPPRLRRRAATARLLDQMQRLRLACQGHFGRELASQIVVASEGVSDRPWKLLAQAEATLERLQDPAFKPPGEVLTGLDFDPVRVAAALAPAVEELRTALDTVLGRARKSESTLIAKQRAMARLDREYSGTVKMFQGLYTFLDQAGLAERLRPSRPRRSSSDVEQTVDERRAVNTVASPREQPLAEPAVVEEDVRHDGGPYPRLYAVDPPAKKAQSRAAGKSNKDTPVPAPAVRSIAAGRAAAPLPAPEAPAPARPPDLACEQYADFTRTDPTADSVAERRLLRARCVRA